MVKQEKRNPNEPGPFDPRIVELTLKMIRDLAEIDPEQARVLDVGCGYGRLVDSLRAKGVSAVGCDVDVFWEAGRSEFRRIEMEPYRLPYDSNSVDVVVTNTILEHVQDHVRLYREIHRILKPGGCALHILPGRWYTRRMRDFRHFHSPIIAKFSVNNERI